MPRYDRSVPTPPGSSRSKHLLITLLLLCLTLMAYAPALGRLRLRGAPGERRIGRVDYRGKERSFRRLLSRGGTALRGLGVSPEQSRRPAAGAEKLGRNPQATETVASIRMGAASLHRRP